MCYFKFYMEQSLCLQKQTDFAWTRMLYLRYKMLLYQTTNSLKQRSFFPTSEELKGLFYHSYQKYSILENIKNWGKSNGQYKEKEKEKIKQKEAVHQKIAFSI